jgi:thiol-disulfide isomerase/thioredoxin
MKTIVKLGVLYAVLYLSINASVYGQRVTNLVSQKAFEFTLQKLNSKDLIRLSEIDTSKVIVIEFFATWCGPCVKAIPHMNQLADALKDAPVQFMYVTYETNEEKLNRFKERFSLSPPIFMDTEFAMFRQYEAWAIPQTLIINKDRTIVANIHPTKLTEPIIRDILAGKSVVIEDNGVRAYFDPKGAENFFKEQSKSESGN